MICAPVPALARSAAADAAAVPVFCQWREKRSERAVRIDMAQISGRLRRQLHKKPPPGAAPAVAAACSSPPWRCALPLSIARCRPRCNSLGSRAGLAASRVGSGASALSPSAACCRHCAAGQYGKSGSVRPTGSARYRHRHSRPCCCACRSRCIASVALQKPASTITSLALIDCSRPEIPASGSSGSSSQMVRSGQGGEQLCQRGVCLRCQLGAVNAGAQQRKVYRCAQTPAQRQRRCGKQITPATPEDSSTS